MRLDPAVVAPLAVVVLVALVGLHDPGLGWPLALLASVVVLRMR